MHFAAHKKRCAHNLCCECVDHKMRLKRKRKSRVAHKLKSNPNKCFAAVSGVGKRMREGANGGHNTRWEHMSTLLRIDTVGCMCTSVFVFMHSVSAWFIRKWVVDGSGHLCCALMVYENANASKIFDRYNCILVDFSWRWRVKMRIRSYLFMASKR